MPIPTLITDLSTTAASNFPQGTDSPASIDDVQRAHASFIAKLRDESQTLVNKDASGGYAGLTLFKLNLRNAANTFTSFLTNAATAARTWIMPDKDGTVAMVSDITGGTQAVSGTTLSATGALTTAGIKEDAAGNVGIGVVPSAWSLGRAIEAGQVGNALFGYLTETHITNNAYFNGGWKYGYSGLSARHTLQGGSHSWYTAPSGTAGAAITWTQAMTLDASGNLHIGQAEGTYHTLAKSVAQGNPIIRVYSQTSALNTAIFYAVSSQGFSAAETATQIGTNNTTGRSINAGGTVNASGADYAEYERNNGLTISKGDLVGFKADGTLTNVYVDAIRFAVKSTNPSYVGGDTWGSEDQVGKRPDEPQRIADKTEQRKVTPAVAATETEPAVEATFETVILEAGDTDAEWATKQADYATAKAAFEAALEAARQQVDRIAYSGKVPCNVLGATPGGYIIAFPAADGSIAGIFVADPDFTQYKLAVGRVNKIIDDAHAQHLAKQINVTDWQQFVGRCEVAVIIH